jgi:response regulator RpfG family c-di-GMP phosphodiesterase
MEDIQYFPINLSQLTPNGSHPFDIYLQIEGRFILFRPAEELLSSGKFLQLMEKNQMRLWVPKNQRLIWNEYLAKKILSSNTSTEEKAIAIKETAWANITDLYNKEDIGETLQESHTLISTMIEYISSEPKGISNLLLLSAHDSYTYNHSLDVAVYCIAIAQRLFKGEDEMIFNAGLGGLLHDIGKRKVSQSIINKPGPLTDDEWTIMKKHPGYGKFCLEDAISSNKENPDAQSLQKENQKSGRIVVPTPLQTLPESVLAVVYQHHESCDGSGYPENLSKDEIDPLAKIAALADVFDALTTNRSYSKAMSFQEAMDLMVEKISHRFDPEMFKLFSRSFAGKDISNDDDKKSDLLIKKAG